MNTAAALSKRLTSLEDRAGSLENQIIQFPEMRRLMHLADIGLDSMYQYFDTHARQGIYPDIETRRAMIPDIYRNAGALLSDWKNQGENSNAITY